MRQSALPTARTALRAEDAVPARRRTARGVALRAVAAGLLAAGAVAAAALPAAAGPVGGGGAGTTCILCIGGGKV